MSEISSASSESASPEAIWRPSASAGTLFGEDILASFAPPLATWFRRRYTVPTSIQTLAWPVVRAKRHTLVVAPTGTGKTWAAFVPVLDHLLTDCEPVGGTIRCVYITSLRATCYDIYRRLLSCPVVEDRHITCTGCRTTNTSRNRTKHSKTVPVNVASGLCSAVKISIACRTADISVARRRHILEHPPDVLITTPESLALLLSRPEGDTLFARTEWVVIDEVHSLAPTKRGADLALSLERLSETAREEPCRIGLSATLAPAGDLDKWLAGSHRPVTTVCVPEGIPPAIAIRMVTSRQELIEDLVTLARRVRSLVIFVASRGQAEYFAWRLRQEMQTAEADVQVHHGALSPEIRRKVERALQAGQHVVVVTSTTLELGVDLPAVDHVALVGPPESVTRLVHRVGRARHRPGERPCATVFVSDIAQLMVAAALRHDIGRWTTERTPVPEAPLDVLCQQLVGMALQRPWCAADVFRLCRRSWPCRNLSLSDFVHCLEFVAAPGCDGSSASQACRWHVPRLLWHDHRLYPATPKTGALFRTNAGTIPSETGRWVCHKGKRLGYLSDSFADLLSIGDTFLLAGRPWALAERRKLRLEVQPTSWATFTRWYGELPDFDSSVAEHCWRLRVRVRDALLEDPNAATSILAREYSMSQQLAHYITHWCTEQMRYSDIPVSPLCECCPWPGSETWALCLHLPLGQSDLEWVAHVLKYLLRDRRRRVVIGFLGLAIELASVESAEWILGSNPCLWNTYASDQMQTNRWRESEHHFLGRLFSALLDRTVWREAAGSHPKLAHAFEKTAETALLVLRNPLGKRHRVGGRSWIKRRLFHWYRRANDAFVLLDQARRDCLPLMRQQNIEWWVSQLLRPMCRVRWLAEPSPFAVPWFMKEEPVRLEEALLAVSLEMRRQEARDTNKRVLEFTTCR